MKTMNRGKRGSKAGVALVYAVFGAMIAGGMVAASLTLSLAAEKGAQTKRSSTQARFLAEGGTEAAKKEIQRALANWEQVPSTGTTVIDGQTANWAIRPTGFDDVVEDD